MLRSMSLSFFFVLVTFNLVRAQTIEVPPQSEEPGIDLDLSTFNRSANSLYWPQVPDQGDYQVFVQSFPNAPNIIDSTIRTSLNSFKSSTWMAVSDIKDSAMAVWFSVSIPIVRDKYGVNLNEGAYLMCNTSDGQSLSLSNDSSTNIKVELNPDLQTTAAISCYMGWAYRADITISKIRIWPSKLNLQVSSLNLSGSDSCTDSIPDSQRCQYGKIKNGDSLNVPLGHF